MGSSYRVQLSKVGKETLIASMEMGTSKGRDASVFQEAPPEKKVWTN